MDNFDFLNALQADFDFDLTTEENEAVLTNRDTGGRIEILLESYVSSDLPEDRFSRYTVSFSTQHCHFEEAEDAADYIRRILTDDALPIEFYRQGQRRFGGDLARTELAGLTKAFLAGWIGYSPEYMSQFEYEIHSWSGTLDTGRRKVEELP